MCISETLYSLCVCKIFSAIAIRPLSNKQLLYFIMCITACVNGARRELRLSAPQLQITAHTHTAQHTNAVAFCAIVVCVLFNHTLNLSIAIYIYTYI